MEDLIPIPTKPLIPSIPVDEEELRELKEDLWVMGCVGLLTRPWNVQAEGTLKEFLYVRGNQFEGTKRRESERWTFWARVYKFERGIEGGWAGCKDGLFAKKIQRRTSTRRIA